MKLTRYILAVVSLLIAACLDASACGPWFNVIPRPCYFASSSRPETMRDAQERKNLVLWQQLTSTRIPVADVRQAVYADDYSTFNSRRQNPSEDNAFYTFIRNARDSEVADLLLTAKKVEETRRSITSPWYYPKDRYSGNADIFRELIDRCKAYKGRRLADRYALQAVRACFAARQYEECLRIFDQKLDSLPDSNLMKQMALGYVAGCWSRLGDTDRANAYFATVGDIASIRHDDPIRYLAERNPDSPALLSHIQKIVAQADSADVVSLLPIARSVLADSTTANRGDWEFLSAYISNEVLHDKALARDHITRSLESSFSSTDFADHARAYRMMLDADDNDKSSLLADLEWITPKLDILSPTCDEWNKLLKNIIFAHWLPALMQKGDHTTAILLCGFADNLSANSTMHPQYIYDNESGYYDTSFISYDQMRRDPEAVNTVDFACITFELMGSLKSTQLAAVYKKILTTSDPLIRFLKKYARTDADYFFELIGTLCLREERYADAVNYLSKVSETYRRNLNILPYLDRDPMTCYPSRHHVFTSQGWSYKYECSVSSPETRTWNPISAKLDFANAMSDLRHKIISSGADPDARGLAMVDYAIAWRNSFEECWALTQYWRGAAPGRQLASLSTPLDYDIDSLFPFIYEYNYSDRVETRFNHMTRQGMSLLRSDEARAKAQYRLGNLRTVVVRYPDTETAAAIKSSCDNWTDWLKNK